MTTPNEPARVFLSTQEREFLAAVATAPIPYLPYRLVARRLALFGYIEARCTDTVTRRTTVHTWRWHPTPAGLQALASAARS